MASASRRAATSAFTRRLYRACVAPVDPISRGRHHRGLRHHPNEVVQAAGESLVVALRDPGALTSHGSGGCEVPGACVSFLGSCSVAARAWGWPSRLPADRRHRTEPDLLKCPPASPESRSLFGRWFILHGHQFPVSSIACAMDTAAGEPARATARDPMAPRFRSISGRRVGARPCNVCCQSG
jgi:hypothetical protein